MKFPGYSEKFRTSDFLPSVILALTMSPKCARITKHIKWVIREPCIIQTERPQRFSWGKRRERSFRTWGRSCQEV